MKMVRTLLTLSLISATLTGCRQEPGSDASAAKEKRPTIAVIPKGPSHVFWKSIHSGAKEAADELGVEILWKGPTREDERAG